jgi:hypothetical protein
MLLGTLATIHAGNVEEQRPHERNPFVLQVELGVRLTTLPRKAMLRSLTMDSERMGIFDEGGKGSQRIVEPRCK